MRRSRLAGCALVLISLLAFVSEAGAAKPRTPTGLTATAVSSSEIDLRWTNNATNATSIRIERTLSLRSPWTVIATTAPTVSTYASTGLSSTTRYYYRVRAYGPSGSSSYSNTASATTMGSSTSLCSDPLALSPANGAELQMAIDCAAPGAVITLAPGTVYSGNFILRYKAGYDGSAAKRITIQSRDLSSLPSGRVSPSDCRISPCRTDDSLMAGLQVPSGSSGPVLTTELITLADGITRRAASGYHLAGLKFSTDHWVEHLVRLAATYPGTEKLVSELPADIAFDRSYFAGSPGQGAKQGLVGNANNLVVSNSYFKDFKDTANDALAIIVWNASGPVTIRNNYLESSGENLMSGGGDPSIANLIPGDISISGNYFFKPTAWTTETSTQAGSPFGKKWRIKNLFELKNALRVTVDGNVFENNWIQADQQGFGIVFTPRNQSGGCSWCAVQDVTFTNNLIKNSIAGFNLLVTDDINPSGQLQNVTIRNNVMINVNADAVPGTNPGDRAGRLVQFLNPYPSYSSRAAVDGPANVTIDHNTAFSSREVSFSNWGPTTGVVVTNNVARHNPCSSATSNDCGMSGGNFTAPGDPTLSYWFGPSPGTPAFVCGSGSSSPCDVRVSGNVFFDGGKDRTADYPAGNAFPYGPLPLDPYALKSSCDGTNVINLATGVPDPTSANPPDYTVVIAANCASVVQSADGTGKVGADWDVVKAKSGAAISGQ